MSLLTSLQKARSEEDVKDAYIKALGLKAYMKGLVDIQTKDLWIEASSDKKSPVAMLARLLVYVKVAYSKGEHIPPLLGAVDREKASLMETKHALALLKDKTIEWPKAASQISSKTLAQIQSCIEPYFASYVISTQEKEFIQTVKSAITRGAIVRAPITPDNLAQVFDQWANIIGVDLDGVSQDDKVLMFYADVLHNGKDTAARHLPVRLVLAADAPAFELRGRIFQLNNSKGYQHFWSIYHRPPAEEYREHLLARRDNLISPDGDELGADQMRP